MWIFVGTLSFLYIQLVILDNELDGMTLRTLSDEEIQRMLPTKIGPAKKLTLIVDELKAKFIGASCSPTDGTLDPEVGLNMNEENPPKDNSTNTDTATGDGEAVLSSPKGNQAKQKESNQSEHTISKASCVSDLNAFVPVYSNVMESYLQKGDILNHWNKLIEETAYHILSVGNFNTKDLYADLGRILYKKYPCIGFPSGSQPWAYFTSRLSQKIRNLRWKWNKRSASKCTSDDEPPRKKKGPRRYFQVDTNLAASDNGKTEMTDEEASKVMSEELDKPVKERNKALLLKAQRSSLASRRKFIQTVEDGNLKAITKQYPILEISDFIVKEFQILRPDLKKEILADRWTDLLQVLYCISGIKEKNEKDTIDENAEILKLMMEVEEKIKFKTPKKEIEILRQCLVTEANLSSKSKSPPRAVVLKNEDSTINCCYIVGDGIQIAAGNDVRFLLTLLIMTYYVFDMAYPKCYQLLGFLQVALLEDDSPFHKGSNYIKFEKLYRDKKEKGN